MKVQRGFLRDGAALALLLLLTLLFFWRIITPSLADRGSFRQGDFYSQFYAFAVFEFDELSHGRLPLWNPYTFGGHPFLADVQSAIFYPLSLSTMLLSRLWGFSAFALEVEAIAHFFLAGVFTYLFAKRLLRHRAAALIAAVIFAFGGYLTSYPPLQLAILETVTWLPLILLLLDLGAAEISGGQGRLGLLYLLVAGLILGIALLAGHPQSAMYLFYVSLLYFFFRTWRMWRKDSDRAARRLALTGLATFVLSGLGLAAAQILPSWEFMRLSSRPELGYQELSTGFSYTDLLQFLLPHSTSPSSPLYIGILGLLLALLALFLLVRGDAPWETDGRQHRFGSGTLQRWRGVNPWRTEVAFWAILAAVALPLSLGGENFLYSLFYLTVPGFGLFRGQERAALVLSFSLSLLAGYGFTALLSDRPGTAVVRDRSRAFSQLAVGLGVGVMGLVTLFFVGRSMPGTPPGSLLDAMLGVGVLVALLLGGSLLWLAAWQKRPGRWLLSGGLALSLIVLDLFTVNARPIVQNRPIENQFRSTGAIERLQAEPGTFRVYNEFRLPGNYGSVYNLKDTWGSSPLRLARYERLTKKVPIDRVWQLLNVQYVVTWLDDLAVPATPIYQEPAKKEVTYVHRLEAEHPWAWIVYNTEELSNEDQVLERLAQPDFDPYRTALLLQTPAAPLSERQVGRPRVQLVESGPSHLAVEVEHAANGLLILSEIHYPGWEASLDGHPVPILRADSILRAVEVPAGQHRVEMTFNPLSVKLGLTLSVATLFVSLAFGLWVGMSRGRKKSCC